MNVNTGMNRATMVTAVRQMLNEIGSSYVTGTIIVDALNRAQRKLNSETQFYRSDTKLTCTTVNRTISLPMHVETVRRVRYGSTRVRLEPTSLAALDRDSEGWENAGTGTPTQYALDGQYIWLDPKPNTATSVYVYHVRTPAELTNATAVPTWLPTRFHDTLVRLTALEIASGFDAANVDNDRRLQHWYNVYLDDKKQMSEIANERSKEYSPRITITGYARYRR